MKQRWKWLATILAISAVILLGLFFFIGKEEPIYQIEKEDETNQMAGHVLTHTKNGVLTLYHVDDKKKTDTFDLKTLATKTERTVEKEEECRCLPGESEEKQEEKPKVEAENSLFNGFEVVEKPVPAGLHVWGVQSKLTPHINTIKMLPLLQELNGKNQLHPVQPNEKRLFLQEVTEEKEPVPAEVPIEKEDPKVVIEKIEDATYLYHMDKDNDTLYAYTDFTNDVYRIQLDVDSLKVSLLTTIKPSLVADWFVASKDRVWLTDDKHKEIEVFNSVTGKEVAKKTAKGQMDKWTIFGEALYYVYENRMVKEQLFSTDVLDVVLGDATIDFVAMDKSFYVLNSFGKNSNNSILLKVNKETLLVDDLYEIQSNQSAIIADDGEDTLFVGRIKSTKDLEGAESEVPEVLSFDLTKSYLNTETMSEAVLFEQHVKGFKNHLYVAKENKLSVYPAGSVNPISAFDINEDAFSIFEK